MTLTTLRRLVVAGSVLTLGAAGGAAWFALQPRAEARSQEAWVKIFPVRGAGSADMEHKQLGPLTQFVEVTRWPQGEIPAKPDPAAEKAPEVKVDPFETKYKLNTLQVGSRPTDSFAQLKIGAGGEAFSVRLGSRIPEDPGTPPPKDQPVPCTPWRLTAVREGGAGRPATATFHHIDTGEAKTLSAVVAAGKGLTSDAGEGRDIPGATSGLTGRMAKSKPSQIVVVREDREKGEFEYELPEEEVEWLGLYSDEEVKGLSVEETKDAAGNPDGFRLKAVPAGSRAYDLGFRSEDKIISVNDEKVTSTADALAKGRRQYDAGASSFQIKGIRKGKEVNYTFHAPKKKDGGKRK